MSRRDYLKLSMPRESLKSKTERATQIYHVLQELYPGVTTFLDHESEFQLLIAVILSAQCTDERINKTTPALFKAYPDAKSLGNADLAHITDLLRSVTYFNAKAKNIKATAKYLDETYGGDVPSTLEELIKCPGVGRKTANVILGQSFQIPGITVDTHVNRLSRRLGFTVYSDATRIERDLMKVWPKEMWIDLSTTLILHGRNVCGARNAKCDDCDISQWCPSGLK